MNSIIEFRKISEFIENYHDKFNFDNWLNIIEYQNLSDVFIRKFEDKIDWVSIFHKGKFGRIN